MTTQTCAQCRHSYEFYMVRKILKDCPRCGARGGFEKPMTREEYYRSMGVDPKPKEGPSLVHS